MSLCLVNMYYRTKRLTDAIVELQKRENTTIPLLQKQLDEVEKRIGNLINSIEEGIATASVKQRLDELEVKKVDIEKSPSRARESRKHRLQRNRSCFGSASSRTEMQTIGAGERRQGATARCLEASAALHRCFSPPFVL